MNVNVVVSTGIDITNHYLLENDSYKVFRTKDNQVYAVQYENGVALDAVSMWKSNKWTNEKYTEELIGKGVEGEVYSKSPDKVYKVNNYSTVDKNSANDYNLLILKQKFLLTKHNLDEPFVFGLYNIKNSKNIVYIMPKIGWKSSIATSQEIEAFICKMKKVNGLGLAHPDYSNSPHHTSFQNEILTSDGIKLIDLDGGLEDFSKYHLEDDSFAKKFAVHRRDQWLYVYNHKASSYNQNNDWRSELKKWYESNEYSKSLSDAPKSLLELYNRKIIKLPQEIKNELICEVEIFDKINLFKKFIDTPTTIDKVLKFTTKEKDFIKDLMHEFESLEKNYSSSLVNGFVDLQNNLSNKINNFVEDSHIEITSGFKGLINRIFKIFGKEPYFKMGCTKQFVDYAEKFKGGFFYNSQMDIPQIELDNRLNILEIHESQMINI